MEKASKSELLRVIRQQDEDLNKYKSKLKDLVQAHKGLIKEKTAIEASLQALTASAKPPESPRGKEEQVEGSEKAQTDADPLGALQRESAQPTASDSESSSVQAEGGPDVASLQEKLTTLTSSLSTLTQEQARGKASYVGEKKQMKQDFEELRTRSDNERKALEESVSLLKQQATQLRERLAEEQSGREREQDDQVAMLRELQRNLNAERIQKEAFEHKIGDLEATVSRLEKQRQAGEEAERYRRQIQQLHNELEVVRGRLAKTEEASRKPDPQIPRLQLEISELQMQLRATMTSERERASEAEQQLEQVTNGGEQRISSLETRLQELSQVVGTYERLRAQDQQAMGKLKERIAHLDLENSALSQIANSDPESVETCDVEAVLLRISRLRTMLVKAGGLHRLTEMLEKEDESEGGEGQHKRCREEMEQLKEEFERYKLRAQAVLKSRGPKESVVEEVDTLKSQLSEEREKLRHAREASEAEISRLQASVDQLRPQCAKLQSQLNSVQQERDNVKRQVAALDGELETVRKRTTAVLAEREAEVAGLRSRLSSSGLLPSLPSVGQATSLSCQSSGSEEAARELLAAGRSAGEGGGLLHYESELSRMRIEVSALRRAKHELEVHVRESENSAADEKDRLKTQLDLLKQELARSDQVSGDAAGAHLEYLKNVVLQYMVCGDAQGKHNMFTAIATVLHFSQDERRQVEYYNKSWWSNQKFRSQRR